MSQRTEFTVNQLSIELDLDRRTIQRAVDNAKVQEVRTESNRRYYHLKDVVRALYENETLNINEERARLAKVQADKTELEVARLNGDLIPRDEVEQEASTIASLIKSKLLNVPSRLSGMLHNATSEGEVEEILEQEVRQILEELSK